MSIVPLNFGAAAPLRLNPHFVHVDAVSEFCVPQFGQNTQHLRRRRRLSRLASANFPPVEAGGYWKLARFHKL
jgi:hypothetical protein